MVEKEPESVGLIKNQLLSTSVRATAILVVPAVGASLYRAVTLGFKPVMVVHILLAILLVFIWLKQHSLSYKLRGGILLSAFYVAGIGGLLQWGFIGLGIPLLIGFCLMAALLFGRKLSFICLSASLGSVALVALLVLKGLIVFDVDANAYQYQLSSWLNVLVGFALIVGGLVILTARLYVFLIQAIEQLQAKVDEQNQTLEQTSDQLTNSAALLETVLNSIPSRVYWKDKNLNYVGCNQSFAQDAGQPSVEAVIGKSDYDLPWSDTAEYYRKLDARVMVQGISELGNEEFVIDKAGKHWWFWTNVIALRAHNDEIIGVLGTYRDITARKVAEEALNLAKDEAEQGNRAKTQFLANMSHEIRTPMNGILGLVTLCLQTEVDDSQKHYLDALAYSAQHLLEVINGILDFSKIEAGTMELSEFDCDLGLMLDNIAQLNRISAAEKGLGFILNKSKDMPDYLFCDEMKLKQVLLNLCGNAVKFSRNGKVEFKVSITAEEDGSPLLRFDIIDAGIGIDPSEIDTLFQPFVQADAAINREFGGTGLGLSISKKIVELMNGRIFGVNNEGAGSTFTVLLPLPYLSVTDPLAPQTKVVTELAIPDLSGKTLLVAEDNSINQLVVCEMLKPTKANVLLAENGFEALALLAKNTVDLVLMDIQMPKMDGCEAMSRMALMPECQQIPVVAITANVMAQDIKNYLALGMRAHIGKPIEQIVLYDTIASFLVESVASTDASTVAE
jgi:PAS domain S-box-containing protein